MIGSAFYCIIKCMNYLDLVDTSKLSPDQKACWDEIYAGTNLFVTARAGAGKSYLIRFIEEHFPANVLLTASTGIAANNIGGRTLHSMFLINPSKPNPEESATKILQIPKKRSTIQKAQLLIIDEISMVSDRLLNCIDDILRLVKKHPNEPFGGMQIALFGDFLQLPPVFKGDSLNDSICWDCKAWTEAKIKPMLITSNFRQATDVTFYQFLSRLRYNQMTVEDIQMIRSRAVPADDKSIRIFSTNAEVDKYNEAKFQQLPAETQHTYIAKTNGDYKLIQSYWKDSLIPEELTLRLGARVMCCKNKNLGGDFYIFNGSLGEVIGWDDLSGLPIVKFDSGITLTMEEEVIYEVKEKDVTGEPYVLAQINQVPLKLAYAVTVHKSQGQTFDSLMMDCSRTFLFGQVYTAFSRARTLAGLHVYGFNHLSFGAMSDPSMVARYLKLEREAYERMCAQEGLPTTT